MLLFHSFRHILLSNKAYQAKAKAKAKAKAIIY